MNAVTIVIRHFFERGKFIGFFGSSGPSHPTIWVTGSTHPYTSYCAWDCLFSAATPSSTSSDASIDIDCAREGTAVLTAVSGGDSKKPSTFGSDIGSEKPTILSIDLVYPAKISNKQEQRPKNDRQHADQSRKHPRGTAIIIYDLKAQKKPGRAPSKIRGQPWLPYPWAST